ncbi:MAG: hypothetical protein WC762_03060 [Methylobacter sp.]|jgi:hypothetical protein
MANPEVVGLLCARSSFFESGSRRSFGVVLSRSELAGYLSGASSAAMNFALASYALDEVAERMLIAHVKVWSVGVANREGWQIVRGRPTISNLSAIAVYDVIRPLVHVACQGSGSIGAKVCPGCGGSGLKPLSGRKIAAAAGLELKDWQRHWVDRYRQILKYIIDLDGEVQTILSVANKEVDTDSEKVYKTSY